MSFKRTLIELGLNETDARFYLAALELGQATVRDVANKAGISRTNAYDVLARLADEGLVSHRPAMAGQKTLVIAEPPERLIELLDQRRKRAVEVLPELRSIHNRSHAKPRVRYYEGLDGIKSVLDATLTASDRRHMFEALWVASSPPATCSAGRQTKRTRARQDRTRLSGKDISAPSLNVVSSAKGTQ